MSQIGHVEMNIGEALERRYLRERERCPSGACQTYYSATAALDYSLCCNTVFMGILSEYFSLLLPTYLTKGSLTKLCMVATELFILLCSSLWVMSTA